MMLARFGSRSLHSRRANNGQRMDFSADIDDYARGLSIDWGCETLSRCFTLRGDERGYGLQGDDVEEARAIQLESELIAIRLWDRATESHDQSQTGFGAIAIFNNLVLDLCASHRRLRRGTPRLH